jgi:succinate dehydrogenase / fumarate reductase, cytochrome b subunit
MSNFLKSSIGKKFFMSITGFFLMSFLVVHLSMNMLLIFDDSGELFNIGANFMGTNPIIKIIEPVLAIGFILHILYGIYTWFDNFRARPVKYQKVNQSQASSWSSRNMIILGALIVIFLGLHLMNFWWKIKFSGDPALASVMVGGEEMENAYALVSGLFKTSLAYDLLYIAGAVFLGLHLTHGFWSAFQTIGWNNDIWRKRLEVVATIFAYVIAIGFSIIPLYFILKF